MLEGATTQRKLFCNGKGYASQGMTRKVQILRSHQKKDTFRVVTSVWRTQKVFSEGAGSCDIRRAIRIRLNEQQENAQSAMGSERFAVTVGIPVWNAMPWLPEAIDSLVRQTTHAFEILVVLDGSTDGSAAYLRRLQQKLPGRQLRILEQPRRGLTATLNRLLSEVETPWLARMDADDVSRPDRMQRVQEAIAQDPAAGLIYSLAEYYPERCAGQFRCSRGTPAQLQSIVESGYLLSICHSTAVLNVEKARSVGGYRMDLPAEDADLWWRMARRYSIRMIPAVLVGFRQSGASVSTRQFEMQELAGIYVQYLLLSELWGLKPRPLGEVARVLGEFLRPSVVIAKRALRRFNMQLADGHRVRAVGALLESAWASPRYLAQRIWDELRPTSIANGVEPSLFWRRKDVLWT
jgi:glycosyltransferase involved in cell wall biosynthesis